MGAFGTVLGAIGKIGKGIQMVSGVFNALGGAISNVGRKFDKFTGKWVEFQDTAFKTSRTMGMGRDMSMKYTRALMDNTKALSRAYGISHEEIASFQEEYAKNTGRNIILTQKQIEATAALSKIVGSSSAAVELINSFDKIGIGLERATATVGRMQARAKALGVSSAKATETFKNNIKAASMYSFKNGVKDIEQMALKATSMRMDMEAMLHASENFGNIEDAISNSARIQMLGGSFGMQFSNPMGAMYEAMADPKAFMNRVEQTIAGKGTYQKETGEVKFDPITMMQLKEMAKTLGVSVDKLTEPAMAKTQNEKIDEELRNAGNYGKFSKVELEAIRNLSRNNVDLATGKHQITWFDENGEEQTSKIEDLTREQLAVAQDRQMSEEGLFSDVQDIKGILQDTLGRARGTTSTKENIAGLKEEAKAFLAQFQNMYMGLVSGWMNGGSFFPWDMLKGLSGFFGNIDMGTHGAEGFGFDKGGYTGYGDKHDVAGIVHRGEFVVNKETVENPKTAPLVSAINTVQEHGRTPLMYDKGGMVGNGVGMLKSLANPLSLIGGSLSLMSGKGVSGTLGAMAGATLVSRQIKQMQMLRQAPIEMVKILSAIYRDMPRGNFSGIMKKPKNLAEHFKQKQKQNKQSEAVSTVEKKAEGAVQNVGTRFKDVLTGFSEKAHAAWGTITEKGSKMWEIFSSGIATMFPRFTSGLSSVFKFAKDGLAPTFNYIRTKWSGLFGFLRNGFSSIMNLLSRGFSMIKNSSIGQWIGGKFGKLGKFGGKIGGKIGKIAGKFKGLGGLAAITLGGGLIGGFGDDYGITDALSYGSYGRGAANAGKIGSAVSAGKIGGAVSGLSKAAPAAGTALKGAGTALKALKGAGPLAITGGVLGGAMDISSSISNYNAQKNAILSSNLSKEEKDKAIEKIQNQRNAGIGEGVGSTAGGIAGSILGTMIPIPVVGTVIGGWLGSKLGGVLGKTVGGVVGPLAKGVGKVAKGAWSAAKSVGKGALSVVKTIASGPIGLIGSIFGSKKKKNDEDKKKKEKEKEKTLKDYEGEGIDKIANILVSIDNKLAKGKIFGNSGFFGMSWMLNKEREAKRNRDIGRIFGVNKNKDKKIKSSADYECEGLDKVINVLISIDNKLPEKDFFDRTGRGGLFGFIANTLFNGTNGIAKNISSYAKNGKLNVNNENRMRIRISRIPKLEIGQLLIGDKPKQSLNGKNGLEKYYIVKENGERAVNYQRVKPSNNGVKEQTVSKNTFPVDVNLNISGAIKLESGGKSADLDISKLLDNPEFKRQITDLITQRLSVQGGGGKRNMESEQNNKTQQYATAGK